MLKVHAKHRGGLPNPWSMRWGDECRVRTPNASRRFYIPVRAATGSIHALENAGIARWPRRGHRPPVASGMNSRRFRGQRRDSNLISFMFAFSPTYITPFASTASVSPTRTSWVSQLGTAKKRVTRPSRALPMRMPAP